MKALKLAFLLSAMLSSATMASPISAGDVTPFALAGLPSAGGSRAASTVTIGKAHQQVTYTFDGHGGGSVIGVDTRSGQRWHAEASADGTIRGRDLDGATWDYSPVTHLYTNAKTGRSCASTSVLHVCAA